MTNTDKTLNFYIAAGSIWGAILVILTVLLSRQLYEADEYLLLGGIVLLQALLGFWALYGLKKCPTKDDEQFQVWKEQLPDFAMKKRRGKRALLYLFVAAVYINGVGYLLYKGIIFPSAGEWKWVFSVGGIAFMYIVKDEFAKGPTIRSAKEKYEDINTILHSDKHPFNRFIATHPDFNPDTVMNGELCVTDQDFYTIGWLHEAMVKRFTFSGIAGSDRDDRLISAWKSFLKEYNNINKARTEDEKNKAASQAVNSMILFGKLICESFKRLGDYALWIQEGVDRHAMNELQNSL